MSRMLAPLGPAVRRAPPATVVVTSVLQTTAGKMIFGRYIEGAPAVQPAVAAVYLGASLALGMLAAWMGWAAALALGARS